MGTLNRRAWQACGGLMLVMTLAAAPADAATSTIALGTKELRSAGVTARAVKPATVRGGRLTLPVGHVLRGSTTVVVHRGGLTLTKGRRSITFTSFRATLGAKPKVTVQVGRRQLTLLATAKGGKLRLTAAANARIRRALAVRRLSTRTFGAAGITSGTGTETSAASQQPPTSAPATPAPAAPGSAPAPSAPTPQPTPAPTPTEEPPYSGPVVSTTTWISSTLTGSSNHKSWINYVTNAAWINGSVTPSEGAAALLAGNKYDYTLAATTVQRTAATTTLTHAGRIAYRVPAHSIDASIQNLTFELPSLGATGKVIADGQSSDRGAIGAPPVPFTRTHVLDLQLGGILPQLNPDGSRTYRNVPATVAEGAADELNGYDPGSAWGFFTFTLP